MEPIPETLEAVEEFGPFTDHGTLLDQLDRSAAQVRAVVPSCVGITLALIREGLAFTLVATNAELAALDAVQYLDDGPCVSSAEEARTVTFDADDPTDEQRWQRFARATAAHDVVSTLTFPILDGEVVTGSVNLYASAHAAFTGHHQEVAAAFGAWAGGAVTNADLDFESRRAAQQAPRLLRDQLVVSQAVGRLVVTEKIGPEAAREMLDNVALRAGVNVTTVATHILESWERGEL